MDAPRAQDAARLLRAFAAEASAPAPLDRASIPLDEFHWLPPCPRLFQPDPLGSYKSYDWSGLGGLASLPIDRHLGDRLAAVRAIRPAVDVLRVGWLFVAGPAPDGRAVFQPLVTVPVKVSRGGILGPAHLAPAGDTTLSPWLPAELRRTLFEQLHLGGAAVAALSRPVIPPDLLAQLPGLTRFALAAAGALGLPAHRVVPAGAQPARFRDGDELVVVAGFGVFAERVQDPDVGPPPSVRQWMTGVERRQTALHAIVGGGRPEPDGEVAGAPGTGKTTTVAAIAADAAARGERVLIVARTAEATDKLIERLLASSAPPPVAFGSTDRREAVLARLAEARAPVPIADAAEAAVARDRALGELARRRQSVARELRAEQAWLRRRGGLAPPARSAAPALFAPTADLERAANLADELERAAPGLRAARRRARARRQLARLAGAGRRAAAEELRAVVDAAVAEAGADVLEAIGGVDLESAWARLLSVEELARGELTRALAIEARNHDGNGRSRLVILRTIGEVHRALRNDRSLRRLQLSQISTVRLTTVLPVWIGSLTDVGDILPARFGLFDLVVVEEATTARPASAAAALLRGQRAVVFGDPSTADQTVGTASLFRLAADHAPPIDLREQFTAPPGIVGGALARGAPGVHPARPPGPANPTVVKAIHVADPQVAAEAVLATLARARARRIRPVAVVAAPARAATLEGRLLDALGVDGTEALGLQVGAMGGVPLPPADLLIADLTDAPTSAGPPPRLAQPGPRAAGRDP